MKCDLYQSILCCWLGISSLILGCDFGSPKPRVMTTSTPEESVRKEPRRVMVQHCLISFRGSVPGVERTQEEAKELAKKLFEEAKAGANFDEMVKQYTNDRYPGIYKLANHGVSEDSRSMLTARSRMVKGFGDVCFSLQIDEYGMAEFDSTDSPHGWHIIKRLE